MPRRHTMTAARRAALRKAQLASAAKRRGRGRAVVRSSSRARKVAKYTAIGVGVGVGLYAANTAHKKNRYRKINKSLKKSQTFQSNLKRTRSSKPVKFTKSGHVAYTGKGRPNRRNRSYSRAQIQAMKNNPGFYSGPKKKRRARRYS